MDGIKNNLRNCTPTEFHKHPTPHEYLACALTDAHLPRHQLPIPHRTQTAAGHPVEEFNLQIKEKMVLKNCPQDNSDS